MDEINEHDEARTQAEDAQVPMDVIPAADPIAPAAGEEQAPQAEAPAAEADDAPAAEPATAPEAGTEEAVAAEPAPDEATPAEPEQGEQAEAGAEAAEAAEGAEPTAAEATEGPSDEGQQTLEMGAVEAAAPGAEAAAAVAVAESETHVATYGEQDLDEMVAQLAETTPAANGETSEAAAVVLEKRPATPTWPFLAYAGVWLVFVVAFVLLERAPAAAGNIMAWPYYQYFLWGGIALAAVGLALILGVWLWARHERVQGDRDGQFTSSLLKGAIAIFGGMVLWWIAYYATVALAKG